MDRGMSRENRGNIARKLNKTNQKLSIKFTLRKRVIVNLYVCNLCRIKGMFIIVQKIHVM